MLARQPPHQRLGLCALLAQIENAADHGIEDAGVGGDGERELQQLLIAGHLDQHFTLREEAASVPLQRIAEVDRDGEQRVIRSRSSPSASR